MRKTKHRQLDLISTTSMQPSKNIWEDLLTSPKNNTSPHSASKASPRKKILRLELTEPEEEIPEAGDTLNHNQFNDFKYVFPPIEMNGQTSPPPPIDFRSRPMKKFGKSRHIDPNAKPRSLAVHEHSSTPNESDILSRKEGLFSNQSAMQEEPQTKILFQNDLRSYFSDKRKSSESHWRENEKLPVSPNNIMTFPQIDTTPIKATNPTLNSTLASSRQVRSSSPKRPSEEIASITPDIPKTPPQNQLILDISDSSSDKPPLLPQPEKITSKDYISPPPKTRSQSKQESELFELTFDPKPAVLKTDKKSTKQKPESPKLKFDSTKPKSNLKPSYLKSTYGSERTGKIKAASFDIKEPFYFNEYDEDDELDFVHKDRKKRAKSKAQKNDESEFTIPPKKGFSTPSRQGTSRSRNSRGTASQPLELLSDDESSQNQSLEENSQTGTPSSDYGLRSKSNPFQRKKAILLFKYPFEGTGAIEITTRDKATLEDQEWLNDAVIDWWLKEREAEYNRPPNPPKKGPSNDDIQCYFLSSHFYNLLSQGTERVAKWTKNIDIFEKDFIFIPINTGAHWFLSVICFPGKIELMGDVKPSKQKTPKQWTTEQPWILVLDSLGSSSPQRYTDKLRTWLKAEWEKSSERKKITFNAETVQYFPVQAPAQENSCDCGVFVCYFLEKWLSNIEDIFRADSIANVVNKSWFSQDDVTRFRKTLAHRMDINTSVYSTSKPKTTNNQNLDENPTDELQPLSQDLNPTPEIEEKKISLLKDEDTFENDNTYLKNGHNFQNNNSIQKENEFSIFNFQNFDNIYPKNDNNLIQINNNIQNENDSQTYNVLQNENDSQTNNDLQNENDSQTNNDPDISTQKYDPSDNPISCPIQENKEVPSQDLFESEPPRKKQNLEQDSSPQQSSHPEDSYVSSQDYPPKHKTQTQHRLDNRLPKVIIDSDSESDNDSLIKNLKKKKKSGK